MQPSKAVALLALIVTLTAVSARSSFGQVVRGVVTENRSAAPIAGAMVVLIDSSGDRIQTSFTDRRGQFRLQGPKDGEYRVQVLRIGFESWTSGAFGLRENQTLQQTFAIPARAVQLAGLVSEAETRCVVDPERGERTAALWEEARKALEATKWTEQQGLFEFTVRRYERQLANDGVRIRRQRDWTWTSTENTPFSRRDPNSFRETGYVVVERLGDRDQWLIHFIVPYPEIMLSDVFLQDHCYRVDVDAGGNNDFVGLRFTAIPQREHPQIEGVLWIDASTGALSHLEYGYSNLPPDIPADSVGGRVEFAPLPSGPWIIRAWHVRRPTIRYRPTDFQTRWVRTIVGFQETGGEVLDVRLANRQATAVEMTTILSGIAFDSTRGVPLAGAEVTLEGTTYRDTTDTAGRYAIAGPFEGEYVVSVSHPRVQELGIDPPQESISLARGMVDSLSFFVPPWSAVLAGTCHDDLPQPAGRLMLIGAVESAVSGAPASGALVRLYWSEVDSSTTNLRVVERRATAQANARGFFAACDLPTNSELSVHATHGPHRSSAFTLTLPDTSGATLDGPGWRINLSVEDRTHQRGAITGVVTDTDGVPLNDALVELPAFRLNTQTDSTGMFALSGLPAGSHRVRIRHFGYQPVFIDLVLAGGGRVDLPSGRLAMQSNPLELEALVVEATATRRPRHIEQAGFYTRRETGIGAFVTRAEFEEWTPLRFSDVMRHIPGIRVTPNPNYGGALPGLLAGRDTRQFLIETTSRPMGLGIGECPPIVYMDGLYLGNALDMNLDQVLTLSQIEAVEVYKAGTQAPAQYNATGSACGVIVIWTR